MTEQEMYILFYVANDKRFVKSLTEEQRLFLLNHAAKDSNFNSCLCCPCFAWDRDEEGKITGYDCTLGGEPRTEEKGECPDA